MLFGKKKLNFFHWFFKKKNKNSPMFQKITMRSSYGWAAKTSRPYKVKSNLLYLPNIKMCGCKWTSPAITKPNSILGSYFWISNWQRQNCSLISTTWALSDIALKLEPVSCQSLFRVEKEKSQWFWTDFFLG